MTTTQNSTETTCIYCNSLRSNAEFSLEHIFPAALGGKSCGDIFKTRCVCNKCNNILGLFVDGAFMKSWFTTNGAAASAFNYLDRVDGGIVPYTYIGSIPDLSDENNLYEFWVGPSGENVYTRTINDKKFWGYAGGNPIHTKMVGRDVIIYGTTTNTYWLRVGLLSFIEFFENDKRYPGNFGLSQDSDKVDWFTVPDATGLAFIENVVRFRRISESSKNNHSCAFSIDIGFADRFLAKLALGIGHSLFGNGYSISPYANHLRDAIWEKSTDERQKIPLRGVGYWDENSGIDNLMAWPGGHTIMLQRFKDDVALIVYVYGRKSGIVVITDEFSKYPCQYENHLNNGVAYVVVPSRRICTNPIPMMSFVSHQLGRT